MENPFTKNDGENYSQYLRSLFQDKKAGDIFKVDTRDKSFFVVRATIKNMIPMRVQTKSNKEGELWAKII